MACVKKQTVILFGLVCMLCVCIAACTAFADSEFVTGFRVETVSNTSYRITWNSDWDVTGAAEQYGLGWYDYSYFNDPSECAEKAKPTVYFDPKDSPFTYVDTTAKAGIPRRYLLFVKAEGKWDLFGGDGWGLAQMPAIGSSRVEYMGGSSFRVALADYSHLTRPTDMDLIKYLYFSKIEAEILVNGKVAATADFSEMMGVAGTQQYRITDITLPSSWRGKQLDITVRAKATRKDGSVLYSSSTKAEGCPVYPLELGNIDYTVTEKGNEVNVALKWTHAYGANAYEVEIGSATGNYRQLKKKKVSGNSLTVNHVSKSEAQCLVIKITSLCERSDGTTVRCETPYEECFLNRNEEGPFVQYGAKAKDSKVLVTWNEFPGGAGEWYRVRIRDRQGKLLKDSGRLKSPSFRFSQDLAQEPVTIEIMDYVIQSVFETGELVHQVWREAFDWEMPQKTAKVSGNLYRLDTDKKTALFTGAEDKNASALTIPDTIEAGETVYKVTAIDNKACKDMKKLKTLSIGKNVKKIGDDAFNGCKVLKKVSGGTGLVTIGARAFSGCVSLEAFTLNSKVVNIGTKAFLKCGKVKTFTIKTKKLTEKTVGADAFKTGKKATYKCPKGKTKSYKKLLQGKGAHKKSVYK